MPDKHWCLTVWMDDTVCPGNDTNATPGIRHVCTFEKDHTGPCVCKCGACNEEE
jgi:hypothetical protein